MINPFFEASTGVFASLPPGGSGSSTGSGTPLAALICATLARRLAQPAIGVSPLDPMWWSEVFNKVPLLGAGSSVKATIPDRTPAGLASLCLGSGVKADESGAATSLAKWIDANRPLPASLNSLAVTGTGTVINLSLAFLDIVRGSLARTDAAINFADSASQSELQSIFGDQQPLSSEPYFCAL